MSAINTFAFTLGQEVKIKACSVDAVVEAILFSMDGVQYRIGYWHDSIRRVEWVFASEIQPYKEKVSE